MSQSDVQNVAKAIASGNRSRLARLLGSGVFARALGLSENGGSQPARNVGQCSLEFAGVSAGAIVFSFGQGDATFIDLTDPATPEPVAAGIYAYTLVLSQDGGGAGGAFVATLVVDDDWYSITAQQDGSSVGRVNIDVTWFSDAGSPFHAAIFDHGGDTYSGKLYVQKIA